MPSASNADSQTGQQIQTLRAIAAGAICPPVLIVRPRARLTAVPGAGATMRVFKSSSPMSLIQADIDAGRISYANFNGGDLSTLSSNWALWAPGAVTTQTSEGPGDNAGWSAFVAISTSGSASNFEVVQTP